MHAVTALLTGIRGAEHGTAQLFARGTATRATWYETFEGDGANSSGDDISLDENGGAELYVSQLVDVVVLNVDGAEVRRFTDGHSASSVEVRSQSFTGTDYDDASTGAGSNYPVTLAQVLDRWLTSAGAIDWDVLLGGSAVTLQVALGSLSNLIYNVKNPAYGAVGDGTTDDGVAVAAAIAAANAAGGGIIFFPKGTYLFTAVLSLPATVSLVGCGSSASALLAHTGAPGGLFVSGAGAHAPQLIAGLRIGNNVSSTNIPIAISNNARVKVVGCEIGDSNSTGQAVTISGATAEAVFEDCVIKASSAAACLVVQQTATSRWHSFVRCHFVALAAAYSPSGMVVTSEASFTDCDFDASACTSGTISYWKARSTTVTGLFRGCRFLASGGATVTALELGTYVAASDFEEVGSGFGASVTAYSYTVAVAQAGAQIKLRTRDARVLRITKDTDYTPPIDQYGVVIIKRTDGTNTNLFVAYPPEGARGEIVVHNVGGSGDTVFVDAASSVDGYKHVGAAPTMVNGEARVFRYNSTIVGTVRAVIVEPNASAKTW